MKIAILAPTLESGLYVLNQMIDQNEDMFTAFFGRGAKDKYGNEYHVCSRQIDVAGHIFDQMIICPFDSKNRKFCDLIGYTRSRLSRFVPEEYEMIYYNE